MTRIGSLTWLGRVGITDVRIHLLPANKGRFKGAITCFIHTPFMTLHLTKSFLPYWMLIHLPQLLCMHIREYGDYHGCGY